MNIWIDSLIFKLQRNGGISRLWCELLPELRKALPDVTWDANKPADLFLSSYYRRAPLGMRSVVVAYDFIHERYPHLGAHHADAVDKRTAIAEASGVVAISQWVADDCKRFCGRDAALAYCGGGERFTRALPNDVNAFQQKYNILKPYILMVGRRGAYKNGRALFQAWRFWSGHDHHAIVCVGGERHTEAEMASIRRSGIDLIRLDLSDLELAAAYSGATALVYPSFYEGFGLPVVEALACGCPVICGDGGSLREVGGDAPLYCDPTRPLSIAAAMNAALDPSERLKRAMAGMRHAKQFTWKRMAENVAEVIRAVV